MGFLDGFLSVFTGSSGGQTVGSGLLDFGLSPISAGMDSIGFSQHGRDQYFLRDLQRELLWDQINAQKEENQLNRDFSKEMLDLNWQKTLQNYPELLKLNADSQFNLWRNQFNIQRDYNEKVNSPAAQVQRMMSAGLNPAQGGVQSQVSSNMGGSSVGAPPNIQGSPLGGSVSPVGLPQGLSSNGDTLRNVGSFLKDISEMQMNQKKIGRYDEAMDAQIKEALANAGLDESRKEYQDLIAGIESFYLPLEKESQVKLNFALAYKAAEEGDEAESQKKLNQALEELNKTNNEEAKARLPFVEMEARATIDDIKASAQEKRAQAAKANQEAQTEKYNTQIAQIRAELDSKTKLSKLATLINSLHAQRQIDSTNYKDAKIKLDRLRVLEKSRNRDAFFRGVDGALDWLSTKIGIALSGSVSSSSSSATSVSSSRVHYE